MFMWSLSIFLDPDSVGLNERNLVFSLPFESAYLESLPEDAHGYISDSRIQKATVEFSRILFCQTLSSR